MVECKALVVESSKQVEASKLVVVEICNSKVESREVSRAGKSEAKRS